MKRDVNVKGGTEMPTIKVTVLLRRPMSIGKGRRVVVLRETHKDLYDRRVRVLG